MTWCAFCVFHAYLRFGLFVYKQKAKQMLRFCKQIWLFNKTNSTYECSNNENARNYVKDNEKEMQKKEWNLWIADKNVFKFAASKTFQVAQNKSSHFAMTK